MAAPAFMSFDLNRNTDSVNLNNYSHTLLTLIYNRFIYESYFIFPSLSDPSISCFTGQRGNSSSIRSQMSFRGRPRMTVTQEPLSLSPPLSLLPPSLSLLSIVSTNYTTGIGHRRDLALQPRSIRSFINSRSGEKSRFLSPRNFPSINRRKAGSALGYI